MHLITYTQINIGTKVVYVLDLDSFERMQSLNVFTSV